MKRILPYVASQFRKDKIWLRRTQPDKRSYQVVLAVDDSKSMRQNRCEKFALEALTLISRAMSRLDVGELGLIRFGGKQAVLHPLGAPFSDSDGPRILSRLHFDQDNRINDRPMVNLIHSLKPMLETAQRRHSVVSQNRRLHQLVVIVADGRFHERSELKRHANTLCNAPGILVAFIILDSPQQSLIDMATVHFENGQPQFRKYLDDFPFPLYIVLNDITSLPVTLADLLKQWFQVSTISV